MFDHARCCGATLALWALLAGCMPAPDLAGSLADDAASGAAAHADATEVATRVTALTWNVEWLGDAQEGPSDDAQQLAIVEDVLRAEAPSLAALQEVAAPAELQALIARWPGRALARSNYAQRQQVALLYDSEIYDLESMRSLNAGLGQAAAEGARAEYAGFDDVGRPPLEVQLRLHDGSAFFAIALHAKAGADLASWRMRERLALSLHAYVLNERASDRVLLLGDFNDVFESSIVTGQNSPYESLFRDGSCVALVSGPQEFSTVWGSTVDHLVVCGALVSAALQEAEVLRDELLAAHPNFFEVVSDHAPVVAELLVASAQNETGGR